VQGD